MLLSNNGEGEFTITYLFHLGSLNKKGIMQEDTARQIIDPIHALETFHSHDILYT